MRIEESVEGDIARVREMFIASNSHLLDFDKVATLVTELESKGIHINCSEEVERLFSLKNQADKLYSQVDKIVFDKSPDGESNQRISLSEAYNILKKISNFPIRNQNMIEESPQPRCRRR